MAIAKPARNGGLSSQLSPCYQSCYPRLFHDPKSCRFSSAGDTEATSHIVRKCYLSVIQNIPDCPRHPSPLLGPTGALTTPLASSRDRLQRHSELFSQRSSLAALREPLSQAVPAMLGVDARAARGITCRRQPGLINVDPFFCLSPFIPHGHNGMWTF